jgi:hypothetical protein
MFTSALCKMSGQWWPMRTRAPKRQLGAAALWREDGIKRVCGLICSRQKTGRHQAGDAAKKAPWVLTMFDNMDRGEQAVNWRVNAYRDGWN